MAKKKKDKYGVFTYDTFPYMVVHRIGDFTDSGAIELKDCQGYTRSVKDVIAVISGDRGKDIYNSLGSYRVGYQKRHDELKNDILDDIVNDYPELEELKKEKVEV